MTAATSESDALVQLRDLHLPAEPSWFPPAPGWWILAALAVAAATLLALRCAKRRRLRAPFRAARAELDALRAAAEAGRATAAEYAHGANAVLKRVAIHGARRPEAAPLAGPTWLEFLDGLDGGDAFRRGPGAALGNDRFGPRATIDHAALDGCVRGLLDRLERAA